MKLLVVILVAATQAGSGPVETAQHALDTAGAAVERVISTPFGGPQ